MWADTWKQGPRVNAGRATPVWHWACTNCIGSLGSSLQYKHGTRLHCVYMDCASTRTSQLAVERCTRTCSTYQGVCQWGRTIYSYSPRASEERKQRTERVIVLLFGYRYYKQSGGFISATVLQTEFPAHLPLSRQWAAHTANSSTRKMRYARPPASCGRSSPRLLPLTIASTVA